MNGEKAKFAERVKNARNAELARKRKGHMKIHNYHECQDWQV